MGSDYARQDRGDATAYDRYLAEMDASMRQKVALTAAHLLAEGDVADMGMGSGSGSHALAALYPELSVVGVDINPEMVERARERYPLPNLRFLEGDIARPCFEPGTMEAILDSSVLHHVTSFGSYDRGAAARAMGVQAQALGRGGVLVVRDFVDPGPGDVWLDVREDDGHEDAGDPRGCSTAALFERFAREFRALLPEPQRGFPYRAREGAAPGYRRYELRHTHAVEFALRKDYRESWSLEVQEEYTYATQAELEGVCATLGLRVLASTPIYNPWIIRHRFEGQLHLWSTTGEPLDEPATNYVIVGQKVAPGEGVVIVEAERTAPSGYLELCHYRRLDDDRVYDLARRPGLTLDVVPWFTKGTTVHVLARRSYPRPVLAHDPEPSVDGAHPSTYVTEPLIAIRGDAPLGDTAERLLVAFPSLGADALRGIEPGVRYFPSPGGILEQVESVYVEVSPVNVQVRLENASGFSTSGDLRAIEARQLLRAAQVGGLPDARLELNTYELLARLGMDPGAWIGDAIALGDGPAADATTMEALLARPHRRAFRACERSAGFLDVVCAAFSERDGNGREVARQIRELVVPRALSRNTVALAVLRRHGDAIEIGLDDDDLPAAQCFDGNSEILVAPAWRLPRSVRGRRAARAFIAERLLAEYGLAAQELWELGGRYHPSAGLTPEVVYPFAAQCAPAAAGARSLRWVRIEDALVHRGRLQDGHLAIVLRRAAHALSGALPRTAALPRPPAR